MSSQKCTFDPANCINGRFLMEPCTLIVCNLPRVKIVKDTVKEQACVAKILENSNDGRRECAFLKQLRHKNIIAYLDEASYNGNYVLFMEKADYSLLYCINNYHNDVLSLFPLLCFQMIEAVNYLHQRWFIHRDIRPTNFVVAGSTIKLIDFGLIKRWDKKKSLKSTWEFAPPEILAGLPYDRSYDIWDLGVTFLYMIFGKPIISGSGRDLLYDILCTFDRTPKGEVPAYDPYYKKIDELGLPKKDVDFDGRVTTELSEVILACLNVNPSKRIKCSKLVQLDVFDQYKKSTEESYHAGIDDGKSLKSFARRSEDVGNDQKMPTSLYCPANFFVKP